MCKPRQLTLDDVEIVIRAEQDNLPVRGNVLDSGDAEADRRDEDEIIARLERGDVWAWAAVIVEARYAGLAGRDALGCCSYASEVDFCQPGGYFDDMKDAALADLQAQIDRLAPAICVE